ncbi:pre-mRNA-processing factor 17 [Trichomonascus vanleenenianus]|uniref:Cdc40p n=1 Tax=Trichomonascus vanleenenianus TaxID=2268995 RepID=UPI003EC97639
MVEANDGRDLSDLTVTKEDLRRAKAKRQRKGDSSVLDGEDEYIGPWAKYKDTSSSSEQSEPESEPESEEEVQQPTIKVRSEEEEEEEEEEEKTKEKTEFHGKSEFDYLGRTYMHVPQDLDIDLNKTPGDQEWYVPKRKIHSWAGHAGGTNRLKFFPKSGHLLLSGGNDTNIKLWDVYHDRDLLRSYMGHSKGVKDLDFTPDGSRFLSCSYDRMVKLWDTETGQCIDRFTTRKMVNCVRFNPLDTNGFVMGTQDNKIVQFDIRTKEIVQQYDHHLGAVNTITFVDNNKRFMTTSDDKSVRVWDWQVNSPIKFIADPAQHSMPSVALHPDGKSVAALSLDNTIRVIGATDRFKMQKRKVFNGVSSSGYSVGIDFSPDGTYLMSGDAGGYAIFWNWRTNQQVAKFKAQSRPCTTIAAHPQETSKVATGGVDSVINYWD